MASEEQRQRRKFRRVGSKDGANPLATATYTLLADARSRKYDAPVLDLSEGGICLHVGEELDQGLTLRILLRPVESESPGYRLLAEVRWGTTEDEGFIYGLEFLPISTAETRNLRGIRNLMEHWESHFGSA